MHYYKITTQLLQISMQFLRFNSDFCGMVLSITTSLLPVTLLLLRIISHSLQHITSLGVSNTTNYLRNVIRSNGSITTYYIPVQLADVKGSGFESVHPLMIYCSF